MASDFFSKNFAAKLSQTSPSSRYKHHELKSNEKGLSENLILYCGDLDSRDRLINTIKRCGVCGIMALSYNFRPKARLQNVVEDIF
jgi:hypothetical protein